jgi:hypothetical protein
MKRGIVHWKTGWRVTLNFCAGKKPTDGYPWALQIQTHLAQKWASAKSMLMA